MKEHPGTPYVSVVEVVQDGPDCFCWKIVTHDEASDEVVAIQRSKTPYPTRGAARDAGNEALRIFEYMPPA